MFPSLFSRFLAFFIIPCSHLVLQDGKSFMSRQRAVEDLKTLDNTPSDFHCIIRLGEGRVELVNGERVSYGLNLVLSWIGPDGELPVFPLDDIATFCLCFVGIDCHMALVSAVPDSAGKASFLDINDNHTYNLDFVDEMIRHLSNKSWTSSSMQQFRGRYIWRKFILC